MSKQKIWKLLNRSYIKIFNRKIGTKMTLLGWFLQNLDFGYCKTIKEYIKNVQEEREYLRKRRK